MSSVNKIILVGRLGQDGQLKYTAGGAPVLAFSVATNKKLDGKETVTWFECSMFGKRAESVAQYVVKGGSVYVEGEMQHREWQDKQGQKREAWSVFVQDLQLLGGPRGQVPSTQPPGDQY